MSNKPTLHSSEEIGEFMQRQVSSPLPLYVNGGTMYKPTSPLIAVDPEKIRQLKVVDDFWAKHEPEIWEHHEEKMFDEAQIKRGYTKWRYVMTIGAIAQILSFAIPAIIHVMRIPR